MQIWCPKGIFSKEQNAKLVYSLWFMVYSPSTINYQLSTLNYQL
ncbi:MAG: hypothetical protein AB1422_08290 [bacterium]